jgi:hypothetical protein
MKSYFQSNLDHTLRDGGPSFNELMRYAMIKSCAPIIIQVARIQSKWIGMLLLILTFDHKMNDHGRAAATWCAGQQLHDQKNKSSSSSFCGPLLTMRFWSTHSMGYRDSHRGSCEQQCWLTTIWHVFIGFSDGVGSVRYSSNDKAEPYRN